MLCSQWKYDINTTHYFIQDPITQLKCEKVPLWWKNLLRELVATRAHSQDFILEVTTSYLPNSWRHSLTSKPSLWMWGPETCLSVFLHNQVSRSRGKGVILEYFPKKHISALGPKMGERVLSNFGTRSQYFLRGRGEFPISKYFMGDFGSRGISTGFKTYEIVEKSIGICINANTSLNTPLPPPPPKDNLSQPLQCCGLPTYGSL